MKFIKSFLFLYIIALSFTSVRAVNPWLSDSITRADLDPVVVGLDSMSYTLFTRNKFFATNSEIDRCIAIPREQLPTYSAEEMKRRMKMIPAVVSMDYNADVQAFIDLFVYRRRDLMTKLLANSQIYFPLFEEVLDKNKMPDELKYLPVIESALNPCAVSSAGATGLWQMMYSTGKMMGLDANSYMDERRDPVKSTHAGVKYLKQLYDLYGDWQLALAAYNSGPGYVNKAIARAGGVKNFWAIKSMLPAETRSYVPTYLAVVYAMHYHKDYKLVSAEPKRELYAVDTIIIPNKITLKHIATTIGMPVEELQFLNPSLKEGIIPLMPGGFALNLPVNYFGTFEAKKETIMADPAMMLQASTANLFANPVMVRVPRYVFHKVHKGENINSIAGRYGVSVSEIRSWNRLRNNVVARGMNLKILTFPEVPSYQAQTPATPTAAATIAAAATTPETASVSKPFIINEDGTTTEVTDTDSPPSATALVANKQTTSPARTVATPKPLAKIKMPNVRYYTVQNGDTLWSIIKRYPGLSINKLKADNRLGRGVVRRGQVLKIIL
jgi:membrane-bound lytic murein transglycosylase D